MPLALGHNMDAKRFQGIHPGEGRMKNTVDLRTLFDRLGNFFQQSQGFFKTFGGPYNSHADLTDVLRVCYAIGPVSGQPRARVDTTPAPAEKEFRFVNL